MEDLILRESSDSVDTRGFVQVLKMSLVLFLVLTDANTSPEAIQRIKLVTMWSFVKLCTKKQK